MTLRILKSTTAAVMCLSLVAPHLAMAQSAEGQAEVDCSTLSEAEQAEVNCAAEGGLGAAIGDAVQGVVEGAEDAAEGAADAASDAVDAATGAADEAGDAAAEAAEDAGDAAAETADEAADAASDTAESAAEATSEAADEAAETAEEATEAADQTAEEAASEAADVADEAAAETEEAATEAEAEAGAEAAAEAQSETTPSTEELADELTGEAEGDASAAADAETTGEAETEMQADASTEMDAEAQAEAEAQIAEEAQQEVAQEDTAETTAAANETVEAEATSGDADTAEVTTETVTEESARSSSENFETQANQNVAAQSGQSGQAAQGQQGLSNFEKFALGALGVLAVGTILNNGDEVVSNTGDRVVARRDNGDYYIIKDDNTLLRRPGTQIETRTFNDGSTETIATRENGVQIKTIRAADGRILRRTRILPDGTEVMLIDDTRSYEPVEVSQLPATETRRIELTNDMDEAALRDALRSAEAADVSRGYSLNQIRNIRAVRALVPELEIDAITFDTGSAVIRPSQAEELRTLGLAMRDLIEENPGEVFLVEGHTDAVGSATLNLTLSDRRAESVALALTEYFDVPPENMVVQGYGESNLKVRTLDAERENRRATVRRITPLLQTASLR